MKVRRFLGCISLIGMSALFFSAASLPVRAWAGVKSAITQAQAEAVVAGAFHPGKVQQVKEIKDQTGAEEWNLLYANGATALVSVSTGEILQYSAVASLASGKGNLTEAQAISLAKETIKKLNPAHAAQIELDPLHSNQLEQDNQYAISFTRVVNGIPFPANGFQLKIDKDGEIGFYQTTWSNGLTFASPSHVLTQDAIIQKADLLMTQNPKTTLFYYLVPWETNPELLYLVQTKGGQLALYATNGQVVTPPGQNGSAKSGVAPTQGVDGTPPWWQNPWLDRCLWTVVAGLIGGGIFFTGFRMGRKRLKSGDERMPKPISVQG